MYNLIDFLVCIQKGESRLINVNKAVFVAETSKQIISRTKFLFITSHIFSYTHFIVSCHTFLTHELYDTNNSHTNIYTHYCIISHITHILDSMTQLTHITSNQINNILLKTHYFISHITHTNTHVIVLCPQLFASHTYYQFTKSHIITHTRSQYSLYFITQCSHTISQITHTHVTHTRHTHVTHTSHTRHTLTYMIVHVR